MTTIGVTASGKDGRCIRCGGFKRWSREYGPPDDPFIDFLCADCNQPVGFVEVIDVREHSMTEKEFDSLLAQLLREARDV